ncbi:MAG: hypothetical protein EB120_08175, partial [Proteobacteria bacterium]|nr:hypothetical protein [Pseudomonadota bacterium]
EKYRAQAEADGIARQAEELAKNAVTSAGGEPSSASASSEPEVSPANASPAANADPAPATEAKAASDLANLERPTLQENANKILNEQVGPHVTPDETGVTNLERVATQLHEHTLKPENFSGVSPETEALVRTIQEKTEAFTDTYTDNLGKLDSPKPLVRRVANNRAAAKWNESPVQTLFGSYNKTSAAHRGTAAALGAFQKAVLGVTD